MSDFRNRKQIAAKQIDLHVSALIAVIARDASDCGIAEWAEAANTIADLRRVFRQHMHKEDLGELG